MAIAIPASSYPVDIDVAPTLEPRNKLTVGFRFILAIPHILLVGGFFGWGAFLWFTNEWSGIGGNGVLGLVAGICAVISWFAIMFANQHPEGLKNLGLMYLRWRVRAMGYMALFRDEYPPFGEGDDYPSQVRIVPVEGERDKVSVGLRLLFIIPHVIVLFFLNIAWAVTSLIAWFAILFTGEYPQSLYNFGIGVFRWTTRVEAYGLLLVDEYPPFSLD